MAVYADDTTRTCKAGDDCAAPVVRGAFGAVRGRRGRSPSTGEETVEFLGIPFAEPPVGVLRWRAPRPFAPWTGIIDADAAPAGCMKPRGEINSERRKLSRMFRGLVVATPRLPRGYSADDRESNPRGIVRGLVMATPRLPRGYSADDRESNPRGIVRGLVVATPRLSRGYSADDRESNPRGQSEATPRLPRGYSADDTQACTGLTPTSRTSAISPSPRTVYTCR